MAGSAEEFSQLKKMVQELRRGQLDLLLRVETLEDRLSTVEKVGSAGPPKPEPILSCVQCGEDYKESRNSEGQCNYHSTALKGMGWDYMFPCCNQKTRNFDSAKFIPGCTKGKHRSKHHMEYTYSAYFFYMTEQSKKARELWMCLDVEDFVTDCTEWGEIGLNDAGKLYILMGSSRIKCTAYTDYSLQELQKFEQETLTAADAVGWSLDAEVSSEGGVAKAVTLSIKPAHSNTPFVKKVEIVMEGEKLRPGKIETLPDPKAAPPGEPRIVPAPVSGGPVLDPGTDYSKDRRNDYETETTDNCPVTVQQHGKTDVTYGRVVDGKWNNLFTAQVKVTNTSQQNIAITDIIGHYMNADGEWVKCGEVFLGQLGWRNSYNWQDTTNFSLDPATTGTVAVRLAIPITDKAPSDNQEGNRAHSSLPQPLHLKVTFTDQDKATASLRFEQGNPPLDIPTREDREKNWAKGSLEFHISADDMEAKKRSDAALYYDEKGALVYRPSVNGNSSQYFYIGSSLTTAAYKAGKAGQEESELEKMKKEAQGSSVRVFVLVDTTSKSAYGLKVAIQTPTSSATGYYLLTHADSSSVEMTVQPQQVGAKSDFTVAFEVPRASKSDRFEIYPLMGKTSVGSAVTNKEAKTTGDVKMTAPTIPGQYEVRYYPAWLNSQLTGSRHSEYWTSATCVFTVAT